MISYEKLIKRKVNINIISIIITELSHHNIEENTLTLIHESLYDWIRKLDDFSFLMLATFTINNITDSLEIYCTCVYDLLCLVTLTK